MQNFIKKTQELLKWLAILVDGKVICCPNQPNYKPVSVVLPELPEETKEQLPEKFGAPNKSTNLYSIETIKKITDFLGLNVIPSGGTNCKFSLETAVFVTMKILLSQKYDRESYDLIQLTETEYRKYADSNKQYSKGWGAFRQAFRRYIEEINTALAAVMHLYIYYKCDYGPFFYNYAALQKKAADQSKCFISADPNIKKVFYAFVIEPSVPKKKQAKNIAELLSETYVSYLCVFFKVFKKEAKFDVYSYIFSALWAYAKDSRSDNCSSLADIYRYYESVKEGNANITKQCFQKACNKDEVLLVVKEITAQMILLANKNSLNDGYGNELKKILSSLKLSRIMAIDGTVCSVVNRSANNFPCQAQNASKRSIHSGEDSRKGKSEYTKLKAHTLFDVALNQIDSMLITEGTTDERHVLQYLITQLKKKKTLLLADRGYDGVKIYIELKRNRIQFIIRSTVKHTIVIKRILSSSNEEVTPEFIQIGQKLTLDDRNLKNEIKKHGSLKLEIELDGLSLFLYASLTHHDQSSDSDKETPIYLMSSLDKSPDCIMALYRLRWGIERYFYLLKSHNSLTKINSGRFNLVLQNILFPVMLYTIKSQCVQAMADPVNKNNNEFTKECAREISECCERLSDKYPEISTEDKEALKTLRKLLPKRVSPQKVNQTINHYAKTTLFFKEMMNSRSILNTRLFEYMSNNLEEHLVSVPSAPNFLERSDPNIHISIFWAAVSLDQ